MTTLAKKRALLQWISSIDDPKIINQMFEFKSAKTQDFDKAIDNAITAKELKEATTSYIKSLDWKK